MKSFFVRCYLISLLFSIIVSIVFHWSLISELRLIASFKIIDSAENEMCDASIDRTIVVFLAHYTRLSLSLSAHMKRSTIELQFISYKFPVFHISKFAELISQIFLTLLSHHRSRQSLLFCFFFQGGARWGGATECVTFGKWKMFYDGSKSGREKNNGHKKSSLN